MDPTTPTMDVPTDNGPALLSIQQAAARLGLKVSWLREKVKSDEVPYVKVGAVSVGFTEAQLGEIVERLTVKPRKAPGSLTTPRAKKRAA